MSLTTTQVTDFFGQELQSHINQHHFQAYLSPILSATTLGLWRKLTACQLTGCSKLDVIS